MVNERESDITKKKKDRKELRKAGQLLLERHGSHKKKTKIVIERKNVKYTNM